MRLPNDTLAKATSMRSSNIANTTQSRMLYMASNCEVTHRCGIYWWRLY